MANEWEPDGTGGFVQRGSVWTHKASIAADGFEFVATEHRGTDYYVPVPIDVVRELLRAYDLSRGASVTAPTKTLWRPVGPKELELVEQTAWSRFPPRLPEQPYFYPVCSERYACEIAERWNVREDGKGFVLQFSVDARFLEPYPEQVVGKSYHKEHWIPASALQAFNDSIVGPIEIVARFGHGSS